MKNNNRHSWLNRFIELVLRKASFVVTAAILLALGSTYWIYQLEISTSRHNLVAADNPYQIRMLNFIKEFGAPEMPIFVVSGGEPAQRRNMVDALTERLEQSPRYQGKTLGHMGPEELAEAILVQDLSQLSDLRLLVPAGETLANFLSGGVPTYAQAFESKLGSLAAALQIQMLSPFGPMISTEQVDRALNQVTTLAQMTDAYLAGTSPWAAVGGDAEDSKINNGLDAAQYLVGDTGEFHIIVLFPTMEGDEISEIKPMVDELRAIRDTLQAEPRFAGLSAQLTGIPALSTDEVDIIRAGLLRSGLATGIGIFVLFWFFFRSFRQSVVAGLPMLLGIMFSLAFVRLAYGGLNLITSSFLSVLMGLGIDFPVHWLSRFNEFKRVGTPLKEAIQKSMSRAGPAILTGALTTSLTFLSMATTEFTAFAELGVITAVGLFLMLLVTFCVAPAVLGLWGQRPKVHATKIPGITSLTGGVEKAPRAIILAGVGLAIIGAMSLDSIRFNYRYFDFLPQESESAAALRLLEQSPSFGPGFANIVTHSIEDARLMKEKLLKLPSVGSVQSASDALPPLEDARKEFLQDLMVELGNETPDFQTASQTPLKAQELVQLVTTIQAHIQKIKDVLKVLGRDTQEANVALGATASIIKRLEAIGTNANGMLQEFSVSLANVMQRAFSTAQKILDRGHYQISDLPPILRQRFVSKNQDALALYVYPAGNIWDREVAENFSKELESIEPTVSGFAITLNTHSHMIISGFKRVAMIAALIILIILWWDFRDFKSVVLAVIPVSAGWLWMLGLMGALDISFNAANVVVLPLVLGIGVDAGVHLVHRCRQSAELRGGIARLEDLLQGTGSAVIVASITTMVGFAGLMLSDHRAMFSIGLIMVFGILCCLVACLILLPAILVGFGLAKSDPTASEV